MAWHTPVLALLRASRLFASVQLTGGKVRASFSPSRFLDIHYDPASRSYSYALIDLTLPYPGDKRLLGWDDFPHPGVEALAALPTHPHHFQIRQTDGVGSSPPRPSEARLSRRFRSCWSTCVNT